MDFKCSLLWIISVCIGLALSSPLNAQRSAAQSRATDACTGYELPTAFHNNITSDINIYVILVVGASAKTCLVLLPPNFRLCMPFYLSNYVGIDILPTWIFVHGYVINSATVTRNSV